MKPRIILDTDLGSDCDDAGALAVLHALADAEEAEILAGIYSSGVNPYGPGGIAAINAWYGRLETPVGASPPSAVGDANNSFLEAIATRRDLYGHRIVTRDEAGDMVSVYRRALAAAPEGSVRIVTIGHVKGLHDLLHSAGDQWSALPGRALVAQKVAAWIAMAGRFPHAKEPEFNFSAMGAARYSRAVVEQWPTPVVFTGFEIGFAIPTGRSLLPTPAGNPVREAYRLWNNALENNRPSWDQTAVLYAVRGASDYWDLERGRCAVDETGHTTWTSDPLGPHAFLVEKSPPSRLAGIIGELMARPPAWKRSGN